ncbi:IS110 family transposase [Micromonospora cremea]|uniref:Transposase IS116/IS110/IS902 family protein n=1 Tax=Micromonospora cremea TaxID=709881 RepID=A0A1N6ARP2_9ACTN|nr:IS110 family transposase [Micromonospora cremea]SIN36699.1 Transposase IS116/IS110/IS902 family protein [Micromonospora cremea]
MLFVGDDWAEDHHDIEIVNEQGRRLARRHLSEGLDGVTRLHALIAGVMPKEWAELPASDAAARVKIGIETERGAWVASLVAAGYEVFAINPMSTARYRERHSTSKAKSDAGDAHVLAEIVRLDRDHHRPIAGDSDDGEAMKLVARSHHSMIWDRTRHVLRLRSALREYFPAALTAFDDLDAPDALAVLAAAPDPDRAARLSTARISTALRKANRRDVAVKALQVQTVLRAPALRQPPAVQQAFAAIVAGEVRLIAALNAEIDALGEVVAEHFGRHPDAELYTSLPGLGVVLGARVLAEFGDDPKRYADAKARKNYAGTSPITRASGTKRTVLARHVHNDRLSDAVHQWALCALRGSPGARAYYDAMRARKIGHHAALRQLGNRLVGILHGCLKTRSIYDEHKAWAHHSTAAA